MSATVLAYEVRNILEQETDNEKLRKRLEKLAAPPSSQQAKFIGAAEEFNRRLAEAAGVEPLKIDPSAKAFRSTGNSVVMYKICGYRVCFSGTVDYPDVSTIQVLRPRNNTPVSEFMVNKASPDEIVRMALACINVLNGTQEAGEETAPEEEVK